MRRPACIGSALSCAALLGCSSVPPEGRARIEVALPQQALSIPGGPVAAANLHADEDVTANLMRLTGPVAVHRHLRSEEIVYVISGEGMLHLAGGDRALEAGDFVVVPRNTPHGFTPTGTEPAIVLSLFAPRWVDGDRVFEDSR